MIRICTSLANAGYNVLLIGRKKGRSIELQKKDYQQKRIYCYFEKGKLFYAEYNLRLFFYLLLKKMDCICAIDLDTILPCYYLSRIKKIKRIYDAHELFCEMKEIVTRPKIYEIWKWIERHTIPHFINGYTVNEFIAAEYKKMYGCNYEVIRNISKYNTLQSQARGNFILYQGAINEGRCFETIIPAMKLVNAKLIICGDGNFMQQAKALVIQHEVSDKISFTGMLPPALLREYTGKAYIGINLVENKGLNNYYSLANRFFDYIHAAVPQLCVNYPAYKEINNLYHVAVLIDDLSPENIARNINEMLNDEAGWKVYKTNCIEAGKVLNWQNEEKKLLVFYKEIFG